MSCTEEEIESIFGRENGNSAIASLYSADSKGEIETIFYNGLKPVTWYSMNPRPFTHTVSDQVHNYSLESGHSYLFYSYFVAETIPLGVKEEFRHDTRIGWCRNLLAEIITSGTLMNDTTTIATIDREWLIFYPEFYIEGGIAQYDRDVGNQAVLVEMSTALPRKRLSLRQPWFYANCSSSAFPLFYLNSQTSLVHKYRFNLAISELLRMEILVDGSWKLVKPELHRLIGVPEGGTLPAPELWANMGKVSENEITWNKCNRKLMPIYVETVVAATSTDKLGYGSQTTVQLKPGGPVKAIFWGLRNKSSDFYNVRSNYTADIGNPTQGATVAGKCSLEYRETQKLEEMDPEHFEMQLLRDHLPSVPRTRGFYGYVFCYDVATHGDNVAALLGALDSKFTIKLEDPEEYGWKSGNVNVRTLQPIQPAQNSPEFSLVLRMLVMRKFTLNNMGEFRKVY